MPPPPRAELGTEAHDAPEPPPTPAEGAPSTARGRAAALAAQLEGEARDPRWAAEQERLLMTGLQAAPGITVEEAACGATVCRARLMVTEQADLRNAVGAVEWPGPRFVDVDPANPGRVIAYFSRPTEP